MVSGMGYNRKGKMLMYAIFVEWICLVLKNLLLSQTFRVVGLVFSLGVLLSGKVSIAGEDEYKRFFEVRGEISKYCIAKNPTEVFRQFVSLFGKNEDEEADAELILGAFLLIKTGECLSKEQFMGLCNALFGVSEDLKEEEDLKERMKLVWTMADNSAVEIFGSDKDVLFKQVEAIHAVKSYENFLGFTKDSFYFQQYLSLFIGHMSSAIGEASEVAVTSVSKLMGGDASAVGKEAGGREQAPLSDAPSGVSGIATVPRNSAFGSLISGGKSGKRVEDSLSRKSYHKER